MYIRRMLKHLDDPEYRAILEAMPDGIYIVDRNLRVSYMNPVIRKMVEQFNLPVKDAVGKIFTEAFPFTRGLVEEHIAQVFATRQPVNSENTYKINNESIIAASKRIPILNDNNEMFAVLNVVRDVTVERRAAEDLIRAKLRFEEMVEDSGSIMLKMDPEGCVTYWNRYAEQFFGFTREELLGKSVVGTIVPEHETTGRDLKLLMEALTKDPKKYAQNENENLCKDGSRVWVHWSNRPIFDANGKLIELFCVGQDVTAIKSAQRESEERYRYLFHESPSGSVIISAEGIILDINQAFLTAFGYKRNEIIGRPAADFIIPEGRSRLAEVMKRRLACEQIAEAENRIISKDGSIREIVFASGQACIKDKNGRVTAVLLCGADVTDRRRAEEIEARHREEMIRTDRMASLGVLVSGVAHEINNPNNFIILNADNLKDIWKDVVPILDKHSIENPDLHLAALPYSEVRDETSHFIDGIQEGARRIKTIVQHLKDFARQTPSDMEQRIDLNGVVKAAATILGSLIRKSTDHFVFVESSTAVFVKGDFQKLEQIVINLITNACHALNDRSKSIHVKIDHIKASEIVRLSVKNEGRGIPASVMPHIFDPFFTTKRDIGGTGLGLSISYGIAQEHGGTLSVKTEENNGTMFTLELPAI